MKDLIKKYELDDGTLNWPTDEEERVKLARAIYGQNLVGFLDANLDDVIAQNREKVGDVTQNQLFKIAIQMVFDSQVALDQNWAGDYEIYMVPSDNGERIRINDAKVMDFHDELIHWIVAFSRYAEDLIEKNDNGKLKYKV